MLNVVFAPVFFQNFHEVAYFADDRQDLLNGINEFLDCSIVIPPSDVEGKDLLKTVASFQKQMLRKRKEREIKKHQITTPGADQDTKGSCCTRYLQLCFWSAIVLLVSAKPQLHVTQFD